MKTYQCKRKTIRVSRIQDLDVFKRLQGEEVEFTAKQKIKWHSV